ncbi:unnamed protein product [Ostreobium quekettii]|uniref:DCD domain-containing protein n=1 Tax=Ostreobium quekettii TaxID=121088 RepID=A0A8S1IWK8_9CHLO|nr:unnamed protein product [Ostreobium quekettii]|eukprot:evm.model.scf_909.6 EVM.evm.TU.scf_909.6   scf_909:50737-52242(-)
MNAARILRCQFVNRFVRCRVVGPPRALTAGRMPAGQVRVRRIKGVQEVLSEAEFGDAILENYYEGHKFKYELSEAQVRRLQALFWQQHQRRCGPAKRAQKPVANTGPISGKRPRTDAGGALGCRDKASRPVGRDTWINPAMVAGPTGARSLDPWIDPRQAGGAADVQDGARSCAEIAGISQGDFMGSPVKLDEMLERRTAVVLGPLPSPWELSADKLVRVLDGTVGVEGRYSLFLIEKVVEDGKRYCFLNFDCADDVRLLASRCHSEHWSGIAGKRFVDNPVAKVWFLSHQGADDLARAFGSRGQWEPNDVCPGNLQGLRDGIAYFFYGFGAHHAAGVSSQVHTAIGGLELQGDRTAQTCRTGGAPKFPTYGMDQICRTSGGLDVPADGMDTDAALMDPDAPFDKQPFDWQKMACIKTEDGVQDMEAMRRRAIVCFQADLEKIMKILEDQKRNVVRTLKFKYKPRMNQDPNFDEYEKIFRELSIDLDNKMGSLGCNQPKFR